MKSSSMSRTGHRSASPSSSGRGPRISATPATVIHHRAQGEMGLAQDLAQKSSDWLVSTLPPTSRRGQAWEPARSFGEIMLRTMAQSQPRRQVG
jgi:hypothetical protein